MSSETIADIGELELVEQIFAVLGRPAEDVTIGPGDDAAVLPIAGSVVLTTDSQLEGTHFRRDWLGAAALGRRAISVNASDLGAMGATPRGFLAALRMPATTPLDWVLELAAGLRDGAAAFGASIVGGDVAAGDDDRPLSIVITAVGEIREGLVPVPRGGARPGHRCMITGSPGRAGLGRLALASGAEREPGGAIAGCVAAFVDPRPPVAFGAVLAADGLVAAMIDVSDGVAMDVGRLASASGVGVQIDGDALAADDVLVEAAGSLGLDPIDAALGGGEDYQLLLSIADDAADAVRAAADDGGIEIREIGRFVAAGEGSTLLRGGVAEPLPGAGWDHFA